MTISYVIIGLNVLISLAGFSDPRILSRLIMNPYRVRHNGEYYRFITSGFIHAHYPHLMFNMFSFYFFGPAVESIFHAIFPQAGGVLYVVFYLMALIVSDISTYIKYSDSPGYNSLGASGAVSAIVFAFIVFNPIEPHLCVFFALCMPGIILGILYLIFSYQQARGSNDSINHDAHLFGALFGVIFCIAVYPRSIQLFIEQIRNWTPFN